MTMHEIGLIALGWACGGFAQAWLHRRLNVRISPEHRLAKKPWLTVDTHTS